jgi:hemoglobin
MPSAADYARLTPELTFVAAVALKLDGASSVGETPDGVRMQFVVRGTVDGPKLNGHFAAGTLAFLRIDRDGVGTIDVRAPLLLNDGALAELEATGRYDFGEDGYSKARQGPEHLTDSDLGWCPRLVTMDARYLWLNRTQFLGVGKLVPRERRVDYDLYAVSPGVLGASAKADATAPKSSSLYERLGRREGIYKLMSASIDSLHSNEQLNRQNRKLAAAKGKTNPADLKQKVTDFICQLAGGPCAYRGRSMQESHGPLAITEADWKVFIDDTVRVLTELGVPTLDQEELLALMAPSKSDIVKSA